MVKALQRIVDFLKIALRENIHCYVNIKSEYWYKTAVTVIVNLIFLWKKSPRVRLLKAPFTFLTIASTSLTWFSCTSLNQQFMQCYSEKRRQTVDKEEGAATTQKDQVPLTSVYTSKTPIIANKKRCFTRLVSAQEKPENKKGSRKECAGFFCVCWEKCYSVLVP